MSTFCAAFVWGLGVSCGAAIGLLVFMLANEGINWALGNRAIRKTLAQTNRESLEALDRRNELTVETIVAVQRIAEAIESTEE